CRHPVHGTPTQHTGSTHPAPKRDRPDHLTTRRGSQRASGPHLQAELLLEQGDVLGRAHAVLNEAQSAVGIDREGGTDGALHDPAVHVLLTPGPVGAHDFVGLVRGEVVGEVLLATKRSSSGTGSGETPITRYPESRNSWWLS